MSEALCPRAGKWIGGCRFEARYELDASQIYKLGKLNASEVCMETLAKEMRPSTYIHDICIRCGRTVEPRIIVEGSPTRPAPVGEEGRE